MFEMCVCNSQGVPHAFFILKQIFAMGLFYARHQNAFIASLSSSEMLFAYVKLFSPISPTLIWFVNDNYYISQLSREKF